MNRQGLRWELLAASLALPLLFGAQSNGCRKSSSSDAGPAKDAGSACVSMRAGRCGGNTRTACTCAAGLLCQSDSGLPVGDVGGHCVDAPSGTAGTHAGSGGHASTGGSSAATGGHSAATGGSSAATGGHAAGGDHGGAGNAAAGASADAGHHSDTDAGGACISQEGEHCGGNIAHPCTCAPNLTCVGMPGGPPAGDVGGTCKQSGDAHTCTSASDCRLQADYCTGCDCRVLPPGAEVPPCSGPGVSCFADPCLNKTVTCEAGNCVAH